MPFDRGIYKLSDWCSLHPVKGLSFLSFHWIISLLLQLCSASDNQCCIELIGCCIYAAIDLYCTHKPTPIRFRVDMSNKLGLNLPTYTDIQRRTCVATIETLLGDTCCFAFQCILYSDNEPAKGQIGQMCLISNGNSPALHNQWQFQCIEASHLLGAHSLCSLNCQVDCVSQVRTN